MHKLLIAISFFLISNCVLSQTMPPKELRKVIKDSANYFQHFKSSFKEMLIDDSVYLSSINIEGTKENLIRTIYFRKDSMICTSYSFIVTDSVKEKTGKKIIDEWKDMLILQLGYNVEIAKPKKNSSSRLYGWTFKKERFWVYIDLYKKNYNSPVYFVVVDFTYYKPGWQSNMQ